MRKIAFWLSLSLIFVVPWENMIVLPGIGTVSRLLGAVVGGFWLFTVIFTGKLRSLRPFHAFTILFILWNALTIFWTLDVDLTTKRVATYGQLLLFVFIYWDLYSTPASVRAALQAYVLGGYVASINIIQNLILGNAYSSSRVTAEGFNPNQIGLLIAIGLPLAWYLAITRESDKPFDLMTLINYLYLPVGLFGIMLTASRGSMIAAFPTMLLVLLTLHTLNPLLRAFIFLAAAPTLLYVQSLVPEAAVERIAETGDSIAQGNLTGRVAIWRQGVVVFSENPFVGVGTDGFRVATGRASHNSFLSIAVEVGLIGFGIFSIIVLMVLYYVSRQSSAAIKFWLMLLFTLLIGNLNHNAEQRKYNWLLLTLIVSGGSAVVAHKEDDGEDAVVVPLAKGNMKAVWPKNPPRLDQPDLGVVHK